MLSLIYIVEDGRGGEIYQKMWFVLIINAILQRNHSYIKKGGCPLNEAAAKPNGQRYFR